MEPYTGTVLVTVAQRVLNRLPELTDRVVDVIVASEPTYQSRGIVTAELLRRSVHANLCRILEVLINGRPGDDAELSLARTTGRQRARQGVALESVLRAYRLASQLMVDEMLAEARRGPAEELAAFLDVATAVLEVVDRHSQAVVEGYRQAESEQRRRDAQRQQALFDALLEGRGGEMAPSAEALSVLGLPARGPYVVVVSSFDLALDRTLSVARDACAVHGYRAAWRTRAEREIGIVALGHTSVERLAAMLRADTDGRIGVSDRIDTLREVPDAYRVAEVALLTVAHHTADVALIAQRLPESLLVSSPDLATRLAERALGGVLALPPAERDTLLKTLVSWYDTGRSATRAAAELYCHRNTVLNRLRRIESLSGESLEDHRYLLMCYLAILTLRLLPDALPVGRPKRASAAH
jgi:hypothetical protein